ncbi:ketoacyl-ACP synthase III family protein [Streptomyces sp. W16]|uniref:ketoacyl-ACP synthase III family protein n=1 Tax=Streptomyces sp. W16 TaxID=3076631 RepID=UPI00295BE5F9|nr:ketoacyl-ACP synthase III family protein [Streptomyces sp. W16]MDV9169082.1 ketoacyl-ACP synthase III family protein [Streptomyces sp. W16]
MRVDGLYLAGIATHVPERYDTERAVKEGLYDALDREDSGILSVPVAGDTPGPDLAVDAAREAVRRSGHAPDDFAAVLHSSVHFQGPDGWSAQHYVLRRTLDRPITAVEVRQGCLGMLAGLELAACRLSAVPDRTAVLLTTGDNFGTRLADRWRASRLFLLGDAGAAAVVSRRGGFARLLAVGSVSDPGMEELHRGGEVLFPPGPSVGRGLNLEQRREYWRQQWARGVSPPMGHFGDTIAETARRTLDEAGVAMDAIKRVAHLGFSRFPLQDMFLDSLGIDEARGTWEFTRTTGHLGAADPIAGLEHLWTTGQVVPGDHVMLIGAAPGMEAGCAVVEITASPA